MDCLFCKIVAGKIPSKKVFEDEQVLAFSDIDPQAPLHMLVVPKRHIGSLAEMEWGAEDRELLGYLFATASKLAAGNGLTRGFRTVINTGPEGGQTVAHLHVHLIGGRPMHWPPG